MTRANFGIFKEGGQLNDEGNNIFKEKLLIKDNETFCLFTMFITIRLSNKKKS